MISPAHKIKPLFVTAIILMLGSHALLPHHHHFDSHYSHKYPLPIDVKHEASESDTPNYHCHAFNHLLDDGYHHKLIKLLKFQFLVAPAIIESFFPIRRYTFIKWVYPDIKLIVQGYDHLYSLRDPPALS